MKLIFPDLLRPNGTVGRGTYALIGVLGFALKHNLDRLLATYIFHRPWSVFNYWVPVRDVTRITQLRGSEAGFLASMAALALPFIWIGVVLTMKRLRSAALPMPLLVLFFVPFLNLVFFLVLCLLPSRMPNEGSGYDSARQDFSVRRIIPKTATGSAAISLLITVPLGLALALLGTQLLRNYGWGLFVALPFAMGFGAVLIYGTHQPRTLAHCIAVACLAVALLGAALLALAFEGVVCLLMAAPIAFPLAIFGGICAHFVQRRRWLHRDVPAFLSLLLIFVPGIELAEHAVKVAPPLYVVRTSVDIQAPPERVWREVIAFSEIPAPSGWIFRAGIAYPLRAEMVGTGVGAERHCVFSTGTFVEPIEVWDEPRRLKFSVVSNPPPMQEWTPYSHIDTPHLHGFLVSEGGQFLLTLLPGGGTRLEGATWYKHGLWPASYWRLWSDAIIHRIHLRVLRHIRDEAEANT